MSLPRFAVTGCLVLSGCARPVPAPIEVTVPAASRGSEAPALPPQEAVRPPAPAAAAATACDAGDSRACVALAFRCSLLSSDRDVPWESAACAERERRACDAGDTPSCGRLADRYTDATGDVGVAKDQARAVALYQRVCDGGDWNACARVAWAYDGGSGVARDPARAVGAFERACPEDGGLLPQACTALADHLVAGRGVTRDEARASRLYAAACGQGVCEFEKLKRLCTDAGGTSRTNVGCVALGEVGGFAVAGVPPEAGRIALRLLERACQRREAAGCRVLAEWYEKGKGLIDGTSVPQDEKRAAALLTKACAAGDKSACSPP